MMGFNVCLTISHPQMTCPAIFWRESSAYPKPGGSTRDAQLATCTTILAYRTTYYYISSSVLMRLHQSPVFSSFLPTNISRVHSACLVIASLLPPKYLCLSNQWTNDSKSTNSKEGLPRRDGLRNTTGRRGGWIPSWCRGGCRRGGWKRGWCFNIQETKINKATSRINVSFILRAAKSFSACKESTEAVNFC